MGCGQSRIEDERITELYEKKLKLREEELYNSEKIYIEYLFISERIFNKFKDTVSREDIKKFREDIRYRLEKYKLLNIPIPQDQKRRLFYILKNLECIENDRGIIVFIPLGYNSINSIVEYCKE